MTRRCLAGPKLNVNGRINENLYLLTDWFYQAMCLVHLPADPISLSIVRAPSEIIRANTLDAVYVSLHGPGAPVNGESSLHS